MGPGFPIPLQISLLLSYLGYGMLMFTVIRLHRDRSKVSDSVMIAIYGMVLCGTLSIAIRTVYFGTH